MKKKPETIGEYLTAVEIGKRQALEKIRATIRRIVPKAEECISYGLPCFRLDGKALVGFGAAKNHCAFYPWNIGGTQVGQKVIWQVDCPARLL